MTVPRYSYSPNVTTVIGVKRFCLFWRFECRLETPGGLKYFFFKSVMEGGRERGGGEKEEEEEGGREGGGEEKEEEEEGAGSLCHC